MREAEVDANGFVHHDDVTGIALNGLHPDLRRDGVPVTGETAKKAWITGLRPNKECFSPSPRGLGLAQLARRLPAHTRLEFVVAVER